MKISQMVFGIFGQKIEKKTWSQFFIYLFLKNFDV